MPRGKRILGENITYHVVSNCNAKEPLFKKRGDFLALYRQLLEAKKKCRFKLHAYCFMQTHIHLIVTTGEEFYLDKIMYEICQRFSRKYNLHMGREGHFWKNRYFANVIENDTYGLACLRYIHNNPVKAKLVGNPSQWPWSCARFYMSEGDNQEIDPLPSFIGLADDDKMRRALYISWVRQGLEEEPSDSSWIASRIKIGSRRYRKILSQREKELKILVSKNT